MGTLWNSRTAGEKRLLILCAIIGIACIPLMLSSPTGIDKKLYTAADARTKYEIALRTKMNQDDGADRMKPRIATMTYQDAPEKVIPQIIKALQKAANDCNIHLREVKPMRVRRLATLSKVPLNLRFTTEFGKTVPFFYSLEDPARKLVIDKITISSADPKSKVVDVEAQVSFYTQSTASIAEPGA